MSSIIASNQDTNTLRYETIPYEFPSNFLWSYFGIIDTSQSSFNLILIMRITRWRLSLFFVGLILFYPDSFLHHLSASNYFDRFPPSLVILSIKSVINDHFHCLLNRIFETITFYMIHKWFDDLKVISLSNKQIYNLYIYEACSKRPLMRPPEQFWSLILVYCH